MLLLLSRGAYERYVIPLPRARHFRRRCLGGSQNHQFDLLRPLLALALVFPSLISGPGATAQHVSIPEEIEWTWEVRPPHPDPRLPNVLLLGDSLSRNYFPEVTKDLAGTANVYLMASSTSVGDPRLPQPTGPHQSRACAPVWFP